MLKSVSPKHSRWWGMLFLMRVDKPAGKILLLWPTWIALWLASAGEPALSLVFIFTAGTFVMSCAGCVINDWADRNIDGKVQRTKNRPLITQSITGNQALAVFGVLLLIAFLLVLATNLMTQLLAVVAVILATLYPFMKRYTHFPQVVLGAAYGCAVPMAYAAQTQSLPLECWLLYFATLLWTVAYDTIYAMMDKADDVLIQVKSTAIFFGKYDKLMVALLQCFALGLFWIIAKRLALNNNFQLPFFLAFLLIGYQQWLIKDRCPKRCLRAFLNNQWFGGLLFVSAWLGV